MSQNSVSSTIESVGSALGGLLDIQPGNGYDENEAERLKREAENLKQQK